MRALKLAARLFPMTRDDVRTLVLGFPDTAEGTSYGYPSYKAAGKFFTRVRDSDESLVVYVDSIDERELLIEMDPETFHLTDHYKSYPIVLARIATVDPKWVRAMLARRWRALVPKKLSKAHPQIGA